MSQIAGTSVTGASVQTFGNTYKSVAKAISALVAAGVSAPAYNLTMNPTQMAFLMGSQSSTSGTMELPQVREQLNPNGGNMGQIFQRSDVTTGYAIVSPVATEVTKMYFELVETVPPVNHAYYENGNVETGDVIVEQYTCAVPRFKHIDASAGTDPAVAYLTTMT
jgi:hypothetical protein